MSVRTNTIKTTPYAHGLVAINRLTAVLAAGMKNMHAAPAPTDVKRADGPIQNRKATVRVEIKKNTPPHLYHQDSTDSEHSHHPGDPEVEAAQRNSAGNARHQDSTDSEDNDYASPDDSEDEGEEEEDDSSRTRVPRGSRWWDQYNRSDEDKEEYGTYEHVRGGSKLPELTAEEKARASLSLVIDRTLLAAKRATKSAKEAFDASPYGDGIHFKWYDYKPGSKLYYKGKAAYDAESDAANVVKTTNLTNARKLMNAAELAAEIAALDTMPKGYLSRTPEEKAEYKEVKKGLMAAAAKKRAALKKKEKAALAKKEKEDAKKAEKEKKERYAEARQNTVNDMASVEDAKEELAAARAEQDAMMAEYLAQAAEADERSPKQVYEESMKS